MNKKGRISSDNYQDLPSNKIEDGSLNKILLFIIVILNKQISRACSTTIKIITNFVT